MKHKVHKIQVTSTFSIHVPILDLVAFDANLINMLMHCYRNLTITMRLKNHMTDNTYAGCETREGVTLLIQQ